MHGHDSPLRDQVASLPPNSIHRSDDGRDSITAADLMNMHAEDTSQNMTSHHAYSKNDGLDYTPPGRGKNSIFSNDKMQGVIEDKRDSLFGIGARKNHATDMG